MGIYESLILLAEVLIDFERSINYEKVGVISDIALVVLFAIFYYGLLKATKDNVETAKRSLAINNRSIIGIEYKGISLVTNHRDIDIHTLNLDFEITASVPTKIFFVQSSIRNPGSDSTTKVNHHLYTDEVSNQEPIVITVPLDLKGTETEPDFSIPIRTEVSFEGAGSGNPRSKEFLNIYEYTEGRSEVRKPRNYSSGFRSFQKLE